MKPPRIYLQHTLECIALIREYTKDKNLEEFLSDPQLQDAVIRRLEIIGEALRHLLRDFREKHPQVPWCEIVGMRNVLIHEYFGVNLKWAWETVVSEMPELERRVREILGPL